VQVERRVRVAALLDREGALGGALAAGIPERPWRLARRGIIGATSAIRATPRRATAAIGALNAPIDWATSTTSR